MMLESIGTTNTRMFLAYFHCKLDGGRYEFGVEWPDDRASVWLDLDQDGVFELEGDRGTELMNGPTYQRGFHGSEPRQGIL